MLANLRKVGWFMDGKALVGAEQPLEYPKVSSCQFDLLLQTVSWYWSYSALEYTPHLWDLECSGFYFYFPVGVEWLIGTKHKQPYLSMKRLGCIFSVKTLTMAFLLLIKHLLIATLDRSFSITAQVWCDLFLFTDIFWLHLQIFPVRTLQPLAEVWHGGFPTARSVQVELLPVVAVHPSRVRDWVQQVPAGCSVLLCCPRWFGLVKPQLFLFIIIFLVQEEH